MSGPGADPPFSGRIGRPTDSGSALPTAISGRSETDEEVRIPCVLGYAWPPGLVGDAIETESVLVFASLLLTANHALLILPQARNRPD